MASPYQIFATDPEKERDGVVINYSDEMWFKIRRSGGANKRYLTAMTERLKPYRRQIQAETMDEKLADRLMMELFVDTILVGWGSKDGEGNPIEAIEGPDGEMLQFNRENAIRVLGDLPELLRELTAEAGRLGTFAQALKEEDAKN